MCTFNGARYVEAQLDSILNQSHSPHEIIIVDDVSNDDTISIVQRKAANDSRIRIVRNETRLGATKNFEKGFLIARNDWIKYF